MKSVPRSGKLMTCLVVLTVTTTAVDGLDLRSVLGPLAPWAQVAQQFALPPLSFAVNVCWTPWTSWIGSSDATTSQLAPPFAPGMKPNETMSPPGSQARQPAMQQQHQQHDQGQQQQQVDATTNTTTATGTTAPAQTEPNQTEPTPAQASSKPEAQTSTPAQVTTPLPNGQSPPPSPPAATKPATSPPAKAEGWHVELLAAVNNERAMVGLPPLCLHKKLTGIAQAHGDDMAANNYFSHQSLDGRTAQDRLEQSGYQWNAFAENIAEGADDVPAVMKCWMESPGHRENIYGPKSTMVGFGKAADYKGMLYWVQDFAGSDSEQCDS